MSHGNAIALRRGAERGFSIIEMIVALGLLAGVLIAVSSLFVLGGKQVKSGRTSSEAMAVGRDILEEMNNWGFKQTYLLFGLDGAANTYTIDTRTSTAAVCTAWQSNLNAKLGASAYATIELDSLAQTGTPPVMNASSCRNIRVLVTVNWSQGTRPRSLVVGTVRM